MTWVVVVLASALAVSVFVRHARLSAPLALLLGLYIGPTPVGQMIVSGLDSVPRFFGA